MWEPLMKMNKYAIVLLPILFLGVRSLSASSLERSISPSQQFVVYGADALSRGVIADLAERTKTNLLALLRRPDQWKTPIVINVRRPQANLPDVPSAALYFSQTGFGLKLQLDLTVGANLDRAAVERQLLRAILLEMIYRTEPALAPGTPYVEPPVWLLYGVLAVAPGRDRAPLIEALGVEEKVASLKDFLRESSTLSRLDSPARELYSAYSFALMRLLLNAANGHARLARYIDRLSQASNDPLADLKSQFPELSGDAGEKLWRSEIARLSAQESSELLNFAETERRLNRLIGMKISEDANSNKALRLGDLGLRKHKISQSESAALGRLGGRLLLLSTRANPILRPVIQEYREIVFLLSKRKTRKIAARLSRVQALQAQISERMTEIDDYMNWFEAAKLKTSSGRFAGYLRAAESRPEERPRRQDPISVYLDALDDQIQPSAK
jgi:hypothetical protein